MVYCSGEMHAQQTLNLSEYSKGRQSAQCLTRNGIHIPPHYFINYNYSPLTLFKLHPSLFMYDIFHKSISQSFLDMFTPLTEVHHYETRQKSKQTFYLKKHRTNFKSRSRFISITQCT